MPAYEFSQFEEDLKTIIAGYVAAVNTAWPDIPATSIFVDRAPIERPNLPNVSIVVEGLVMSAGPEATVKGIYQTFGAMFHLRERVEEESNVMYQKINRMNRLTAALMANRHFLNAYELPIVDLIELAEEEPRIDVAESSLHFVVNAENYRTTSI